MFEFSLEILIGVGLPAFGAAVFVIRHFWQKTKCFYLLKQKVKDTQDDIEYGKEQHEKIFDRLNNIDKNIAGLQAQVKIILNKLT